MSDPAMVSKCIVGLLWGNEFPTWRQICPPKQSHNALWNHLDPVSRNLKVVRCTATICGVLRGRGGVHSWGTGARLPGHTFWNTRNFYPFSLFRCFYTIFFRYLAKKEKFLISSVVTSSQYSWLECAIFELPDLDPVFLGSSTAWMLGSTPPSAKVTWDKSWLSSSSLRTANCKWRGMIRDFLLSRAAFPASSSTSAVRYSNTAARYTGAPLPTRSE